MEIMVTMARFGYGFCFYCPAVLKNFASLYEPRCQREMRAEVGCLALKDVTFPFTRVAVLFLKGNSGVLNVSIVVGSFYLQ